MYGMNDSEELFFTENITHVNRFIEKIILFTLILPFLFLLGDLIGVFSIPYRYITESTFLVMGISIINICVNRRINKPALAKYVGIISAIFIVGFFSASGNIGIYISYGFFPFMASLYYEKKFTRYTTILTAIMIVITMWYRSVNSFAIERQTGEPMSQLLYFTSFTAGFMIEIFFAYLIAISMTRRGFNTHQNLLNQMNKKSEVNAKLEHMNQQLTETQHQIIQFLAKILGSHDLFTGNHVVHTKTYVGLIARQLKKNGFYTDELDEETISVFEISALLHDIGKIHIPEGILNKNGKFTPEEFNMMKIHPEEGLKLLEFLPPIMQGRFNEIAKEMAYCHHEKWDGTGYPRGISGFSIPLSARIMAAADVLDALLSQRLYKKPMEIDDAMLIFKNSMGFHFEPCIAQAVLDAKNDIATCDAYFKREEIDGNKVELEWWEKYHDYYDSKKQSTPS